MRTSPNSSGGLPPSWPLPTWNGVVAARWPLNSIRWASFGLWPPNLCQAVIVSDRDRPRSPDPDVMADVATAVEAIALGRLTSTALVEKCIQRYLAVESHVHAFAWFDQKRARDCARRSDGLVGGAMRGVPIGIKDIVDTAGIPTERGSTIFKHRIPTVDAQVVANLRASGAIDVGKTVTTELALLAPGPTRNPYDTSRTPGGSSMGSAVAVATGVVSASMGTQTMGSIVRPAAFCGIVGYKPTFGRISRAGVMELSGTLDQVGAFARTVRGVATTVAAMAGDPTGSWWNGPILRPPRLAALPTGEWRHATRAVRDRFLADVARLRDVGAIVEWPEEPSGLGEAPRSLAAIVRYESARSIGAEVMREFRHLQDETRVFLREGLAVTDKRYVAALISRDVIIDAFMTWMRRFDAIVTPATVGEAPPRSTTGDPRFCTRWTLIGAPAIVIPTGLGPSGLPIGLQLVSAPGNDFRLLATATWAEEAFKALSI